MDGRIVLVNPANNKVAVRDRFGHYSVFVVNTGDVPNHGDLISGRLDSPGEVKLVNVTQKKLIAVRITRAGEPVARRTKDAVFRSNEPITQLTQGP